MSERNDDVEMVRFNVQMPKKLRDDAKRNSDRGDLSEDVRSVFRQRAYGVDDTGEPSEIERTKAELREVRRNIDDLRLQRSQIEAEIKSDEARAARLEERLSELKEERGELEQSLTVLENMLHEGDRMWPVRIKNAVDVDQDTAQELYQQLKERNSELPDEAFEEPSIHSPTDWREVQ